MARPPSSEDTVGQTPPAAPPSPRVSDALDGRLGLPRHSRGDDEQVVRWLRVLGGRGGRLGARRSSGRFH